MNIKICINEKLQNILLKNNISKEDYSPAYGGESVGLDLYYTGEKTLYITKGVGSYSSETTLLKKVLIPTGLKIILPLNYVGLLQDRGSISKTKFIRRAGVIDPGYTGEIFVNLTGDGIIEPGDKLPVQLIVVPCVTQMETISEESFKELTQNTKRKENKIGSSDTE